MIMNIGRVCIVKKGRDFGKLCMVVSEPKSNKVEVEGPHVKKHSVNVLHLWPIDKVLSVSDAKKLNEKVSI